MFVCFFKNAIPLTFRITQGNVKKMSSPHHQLDYKTNQIQSMTEAGQENHSHPIHLHVAKTDISTST